jgi:hypothetical protein
MAVSNFLKKNHIYLLTPKIRIFPTYNFTTDIIRFDAKGPFNLLNAELNPICHLLALLGAHHILHVSRVRVDGKLF